MLASRSEMAPLVIFGNEEDSGTLWKTLSNFDAPNYAMVVTAVGILSTLILVWLGCGCCEKKKQDENADKVGFFSLKY